MIHQIDYTVSQFKDIYDFKVTFPCAKHLWDVKYEVEFLDDVKDYLFHFLEPKLIYIKKRTRPYIEPDVAFVTTKVANINMDD